MNQWENALCFDFINMAGRVRSLGQNQTMNGSSIMKKSKRYLWLIFLSALVFSMSMVASPLLCQAATLGDVFGRIEGPGIGEIFDAVEQLSPGPVQDGVLQQLNNEENGISGSMGTEVSTIGGINVGARLAALRSGGASLISYNNGKGKYSAPFLFASNNIDFAGNADSANETFSRLGFFINGIGAYGDRDSTLKPEAYRGEPGFDFDSWGLVAGVDNRFSDQFILGAAFGYAETDADIDNDAGSLDQDGYSVLAYSTYYVNQWHIDAILNFGGSDYDANRNIRPDPEEITMENGDHINGIARSDYDGWQYGYSLGGGYDFSRSGFTCGPYVRLNYQRVRIDDYREKVEMVSGTPDVESVGLEIQDQDITSLATVVGTHISYAHSTSFGVWIPQISFSWEHEFDDNSRKVIAQYIEDTANNEFTIQTDDPDEDFFNLGLGLSAIFPHGITAFVYYETPLGLKEVTSHNFTGGVRFEF